MLTLIVSITVTKHICADIPIGFIHGFAKRDSVYLYRPVGGLRRDWLCALRYHMGPYPSSRVFHPACGGTLARP